MKLSIYKEKAARVPAKKVRELFELVAEHEAKPNWQAGVSLVFTTDRKIQRLNKQYRGMNKPTDVLSFNIDDPEKPDNVFGEVYISCDTAIRQARQLGHAAVDEYMRLACHGFMHLFGYDHQKETEAEAMETREAMYLRRMTGK